MSYFASSGRSIKFHKKISHHKVRLNRVVYFSETEFRVIDFILRNESCRLEFPIIFVQVDFPINIDLINSLTSTNQIGSISHHLTHQM
jgi:hypothetical protein